MSEYQTLQLEVDQAIAHVQLNRTHKANAFNATMWQEIKKAFTWIHEDSTVRVVVLSGQGQHFSAGIDFESLLGIVGGVSHLPEGLRQERLKQIIQEFQDSFSGLERCSKPILAAIHGACLGAGVDLIASCDMRYATEDARFSIKEVDLGIVADLGSLQRLPKLLGEGVLRELAFTGRDFNGLEAKTIGLVNQIYENPTELLANVMILAKNIAQKSPLTVRGIKEMLNYARDHSIADNLNFIAMRNAAMLLSADTEEAVTATMQKRTAIFED
ncbi:MAG: enoyl-CoA hydratase [Beggiatoa sp. IS2]|nr:MAG: enoyl-CoA hydratase [Beggiatoa sp. IS2]